MQRDKTQQIKKGKEKERKRKKKKRKEKVATEIPGLALLPMYFLTPFFRLPFSLTSVDCPFRGFPLQL